MKNSDELNRGYLSHNILFIFYLIVDFLGYKIFKNKPMRIKGNKLLFVNLGLIGDLILFRYTIENFLALDYCIDILIQEEYKFLFLDIKNINIITISNYKDKKFLSGFYKICSALFKNNKKYSVSLHFRAYLGTGILSTFIMRTSNCYVGYGTSGFGFLLNKCIKWETDVHETVHLLNVLRVIQPNYNSLNVNVYDKLIYGNIKKQFYLQNDAYVVIHATSQNSMKNIPKYILKSIITYILEQTNFNIVFVGSKTEIFYIQEFSKLSNRIVISNGQIGFFDIKGLVYDSKFFIGIDSSIAHLLSSCKIPKIILWHYLNSKVQWKPLGDDYYFIDNVGLEKNENIYNQLVHLVNKVK